MKKAILFAIAGIIFVSIAATTFNDDGKAGYTNSPGEANCHNGDCHHTFNPNSGTGAISVESTIPEEGYIPGSTYQVKVKVKQTGLHLFGFGFEALNAGGANIGTLAITDAAKTWLKTKTVNGNSRNNVTHKKNGGSSQDSMVFVFNWIAPTVDTTDAHFYFAGVSANANNGDSGDYVYTGSKTVTKQVIVSATNDLSGVNALSVYPNPISDVANVTYTLQEAANVEIAIYDINGKMLRQLSKGTRSSGTHQEQFNMNDNVVKGVYLLEIKTDKGTKTTKIML